MAKVMDRCTVISKICAMSDDVNATALKVRKEKKIKCLHC